MKKSIQLLFLSLNILLLLSPISCKKAISKQSSSVKNNDTILLKNKDIYFVSPNNHQISVLKKKYGDSFYTIADDANNYFSLATEYLDSLKVKYSHITNDRTIVFKKGNKIFKIPEYSSGWYSIFYDSGTYKIVDLPNFIDHYKSFFNGKHHNPEKKLQKWYGLYLNSDSGEIKSYEEILKRIGWYKLSVRQDEIYFESDQRMETEFPTESPGGYYINYKCNYKITGDTLKLYKQNEDIQSISKEHSGTGNAPILTIYKNNDKYYGISQDILNSENLANSIRTKGVPPYRFLKFNTKK